MKLTEYEARERWCPHRAATTSYGDDFNAASCIGSACMMWVWDETLDTDNDGNPTGGTNYDTEGHCGLIKEG